MSRKEVNPESPVRGRPREARVDDAILDAALALFAQGGLAAATFEGVAAHAGVSRSGVYRRWTDREEMVTAALARHRGQGERGAEDWPSAGSVAAVMRLFRTRAVQSLCDPQSLALLGQVAALGAGSGVGRAYWTTIVAPRRRAFAAMIREARGRGELPAGPDPEVVQDLLAGALMYRALMHPEPLTRPAARRFVDDVLTTLGLSSGPTSQ